MLSDQIADPDELHFFWSSGMDFSALLPYEFRTRLHGLLQYRMSALPLAVPR